MNETINSFLIFIKPFLPAAAIFAIVLLAIFLVKVIIVQRLKAQNRRIPTFIAKQIDNISLVTALVTGFYFACFWIPNLNPQLKNLSTVLVVIVWAWQIIQVVSAVIDYFFAKVLTKQGSEGTIATNLVSRLLKIGLWIFVILVVLANLGFDVTSLVAGLGIGGIAIALAVQNVVVDVIGTLSILTNHPFKINDQITANNNTGIVEKIGIRSTFLRTVEGYLVIIPNGQLAGAVVKNLGSGNKYLAEKTVSASVTDKPELTADIPAFINEVLSKAVEIDPEDWSVNLVDINGGKAQFLVRFYVRSKQYQDFMSIQTEILTRILQRLAKEGVKLS